MAHQVVVDRRKTDHPATIGKHFQGVEIPVSDAVGGVCMTTDIPLLRLPLVAGTVPVQEVAADRPGRRPNPRALGIDGLGLKPAIQSRVGPVVDQVFAGRRVPDRVVVGIAVEGYDRPGDGIGLEVDAVGGITGIVAPLPVLPALEHDLVPFLASSGRRIQKDADVAGTRAAQEGQSDEIGVEPQVTLLAQGRFPPVETVPRLGVEDELPNRPSRGRPRSHPAIESIELVFRVVEDGSCVAPVGQSSLLLPVRSQRNHRIVPVTDGLVQELEDARLHGLDDMVVQEELLLPTDLQGRSRRPGVDRASNGRRNRCGQRRGNCATRSQQPQEISALQFRFLFVRGFFKGDRQK